MQPATLPATSFLRQSQIIGNIVPVGASTLWRWVNAGTFPKPVKLSERVTAWKTADVQAWIDQQSASGDKAAA